MIHVTDPNHSRYRPKSFTLQAQIIHVTGPNHSHYRPKSFTLQTLIIHITGPNHSNYRPKSFTLPSHSIYNDKSKAVKFRLVMRTKRTSSDEIFLRRFSPVADLGF